MKRVPLHLLAGLFCAMLLPLSLAHAQDSNQDGNATQTGLDRIVEFSIQPQGLDTAMVEFANQSGIQVVTPGEELANMNSPGVTGSYSAAAALDRLLEGTAIEYEAVGDATIALTGPALSAATAGQNEIGQRQPGIEEIIVTGQKREERIQDVPIAISAFSQEDLDAQKLEGGYDLLKAIPNVTFSKTNFSGYNFQIRGIGTQAISATTDPGVAVAQNQTTLIVNRLFEQEYLDVERVEVLRGPQGTLFGRNATGGVINVITNKPEMGVYEGMIDLEIGNYGAERLRGHYNFPLNESDTLAARIAYASTEREGYGTNLAADDFDVSRDLDNRDLWTGRISLGWQPTDRFRADLIWERFREDDNRLRTSKQLCHRDPGPDEVAGLVLNDIDPAFSGPQQSRVNSLRTQLSQGCLPRSLFDKGDPGDPNDDGAYGKPSGNGIPFVRGGRLGSFAVGPDDSVEGCESVDTTFASTAGTSALVNPCLLNPIAAGAQSQDLRTIYSPIEPQYEAESDYYELSMDFELSDGLTLASQTVYMENYLFSTQDYLRFETVPGFFGDSRAACSGSFDPDAVCEFGTEVNHTNAFFRNVTPGGVHTDPQLGDSNRLLLQDVSQQETEQLSTELRLTSSFGGPWNFSLGANYTRFEDTGDYFVFSNMLTALAQAGLYRRDPEIDSAWCGDAHTIQQFKGHDVAECAFIQQGSLKEVAADPEGHNFFLSRNPYELDSAAVFGELYYDITPRLKLTAGLRLSWDRKTFTPVPSQTLLTEWEGDQDIDELREQCGVEEALLISGVACSIAGTAPNGRGYPAQPDIVQEWRVPTGRIGLDWQPLLGFTDETLIYAFYTRGYKAGGANPPLQAPPSGLRIEQAQGAAAPRTFKAEYVNAYEVGTKNTLFGGALVFNGSAFYYDYKDYQVSKIVDRSAANENFDAEVWGLELETVFSPTLDTVFNANIGYLRTRIADGEESLDLMDRAQGGDHHFVNPDWANLSEEELNCGAAEPDERHVACDYPNGFDEWIVVKPTFLQASNCVAPAQLVRDQIEDGAFGPDSLSALCPARNLNGQPYRGYNSITDAPNSGAGFFADIGGNELPNAPRFTVSLGAQHTYQFPGGDWSATGRVDWYWQDESYHRVYNTEYDRLEDWTNTNLSFWVENRRLGLTVEAYVKNAFDRTPVTGAFLNSDDTELTTNVFTLDPRLIGVSVRKEF